MYAATTLAIGAKMAKSWSLLAAGSSSVTGSKATGCLQTRCVHDNKRIGHAAMETTSGDRRIRQKHVLGYRQHCGNFRLISDALQGGCQLSKPGICALIRELDAQVVP